MVDHFFRCINARRSLLFGAKRSAGWSRASVRVSGDTGSVHVSGRQCGRVKGPNRRHGKVGA
jgi:hypothetical protein